MLSAVSRARTTLPIAFRADRRGCVVSQSVSWKPSLNASRQVGGWPRPLAARARFQRRIIEKQEHIAVPACLRRDQTNGALPSTAETPFQLFRKLCRKSLNRIAKLIRIQMAEHPAERVVTGRAVGPG